MSSPRCGRLQGEGGYLRESAVLQAVLSFPDPTAAGRRPEGLPTFISFHVSFFSFFLKRRSGRAEGRCSSICKDDAHRLFDGACRLFYSSFSLQSPSYRAAMAFSWSASGMPIITGQLLRCLRKHSDVDPFFSEDREDRRTNTAVSRHIPSHHGDKRNSLFQLHPASRILFDLGDDGVPVFRACSSLTITLTEPFRWGYARYLRRIFQKLKVPGAEIPPRRRYAFYGR